MSNGDIQHQSDVVDMPVQKFDSLAFWMGLLFHMLTAIYNQCSSVNYIITNLPLFKNSAFLIGISFNDICNSSYYSVQHPMVAQLVNNELSTMQKQPRPNLRFSAVAGLTEMSTYSAITKAKEPLQNTEKTTGIKHIPD
jgi:hypothetical protein